jgi:plastocyanin
VATRFLVTFGVVAVLTLVLASGSPAASASRQVVIRDDCDPATFNAVVGPGTCVKDGSTTFSEFVDQLITQGRAPAWRFAPDHLSLAAGGTIVAPNKGGETHTFSEVANFGGGCIGFLNDLLGLSPVPECAGFPGGVFGATAIPAGGTRTVTLAPGIHRIECLIHPWMRTTVVVH